MPFWTPQERQQFLDRYDDERAASAAANQNVFKEMPAETTMQSVNQQLECTEKLCTPSASQASHSYHSDHTMYEYYEDFQSGVREPQRDNAEDLPRTAGAHLGTFDSTICPACVQSASHRLVPGTAEGARLLTCWCTESQWDPPGAL